MKLSKRKQAIKDKALLILGCYKDGEKITAPDEVEFIHSLLEKHPSKRRKYGSGFRSFICQTKFDGRKCFAIERIDNTIESFGVNQCVQPRTRRSEVHQAMRASIHDQILDFWHSYCNSTESAERLCPITGEHIDEGNHAIDHYGESSFVTIADDFVQSRRLDYDDIELEYQPVRETFKWLKDESLRSDFQSYHFDRAQLRAVSKTGNSILEQERRKKSGR